MRGTSITLAGCTLPEGVSGQRAVRLRAARCLARLVTGLIAMNVAGGTTPELTMRTEPNTQQPARAEAKSAPTE